MEKVRVGVVGTGSISNEHIKAYLKNPNVELVSFCDINATTLKAMGEQYGVSHLYASEDEMLANESLDAVSVCTWNSAHAACAIKALNAGVNVLSEKPMSTDVQSAEQMIAAAKANNKLLMNGFVRRFGNDADELQRLIQQNFFGEIYFAKAEYLRRHGNPGGWFGERARSGGGPLIDLGVHVLDLIHYLCGQPKVVSVYGATFNKLVANRAALRDRTDYSSVGRSENDVFDVEDLATALIRFENGLVIYLGTSYNLNIKQDVTNIELFGTNGGAKIDPEIELFTELDHSLVDIDYKKNTALDFDGLFGNEINNFINSILGTEICRSPAEDGLNILNILSAIYESARTGHEVVL